MKKMIAVLLVLVLMFAFNTGAFAKGKSDTTGHRGNSKDTGSELNEVRYYVDNNEDDDMDMDDDDFLEGKDDENDESDFIEENDKESDFIEENDKESDSDTEDDIDIDENDDANKVAEKALKNKLKVLRKRVDILKDKGTIIEKELKIREELREERLEKLTEALENLGEEIDDIEDVMKEYQPARGKFRVKGEHPVFDVPPVIKEGRTLIPIRAITEGLGAKVEWNGEEQKVIVKRDDKVIEIYLESREILINGQAVTIDVPASMLANRVFVPVRFISETLGDQIEYDPETGDITVGEDTEEGVTEEDIVENTTGENTISEGLINETTNDNNTDGDTTKDSTTEQNI